MIWLLCILLGLTLGQHIKITVNPSALEWLSSTWAQLTNSIPVVAEWCDRAIITKLQTAAIGSSRVIQPGEAISEGLSTSITNKVDNPPKSKAKRQSEDYL